MTPNRSQAAQKIVIIADDLSGAAELAGIAYSHGYSAEVQRQFDPASEAEVIAVATDSRSLPPHIAADRVRNAARAILPAQPACIFKKVDSILRGNVRAEIEALLEATSQKRCLLIPANPSRGRTIVGGSYLIADVPLDQTDLANDPEHPRTTSRVTELISADRQPPGVIAVPDISSIEDLNRQALRLDEETLPAGAADFFALLLAQQGRRDGPPTAVARKLTLKFPALWVCGSRAAWHNRQRECRSGHVPIVALDDNPLPLLAARAAAELAQQRRLMIAIGDRPAAGQPDELREQLAQLVQLVLHQTPAATLLVEGGATAEAVIQRLGWRRLAVAAVAPAGIGILQPIGLATAPQVWIKPGSYSWPEAVWAAPSPPVALPPGARGEFGLQ